MDVPNDRGVGLDLEVDLRAASIEDAPEILEVQRLAYWSEGELYQDFALPPIVQTLEELRAEFHGFHVLVATTKGKVIGAVRGREQGDNCRITRLFVHPDWRRHGVGARLMAAIEASFPRTPRFELFTAWKSVANLRFYERLGYRRFEPNDRGTGPRCGDVPEVWLEKVRGRC